METQKGFRAEAERFLAGYGAALLALHRKFPDGSFERVGAFSKLRRRWAKKILAAFDES